MKSLIIVYVIIMVDILLNLMYSNIVFLIALFSGN